MDGMYLLALGQVTAKDNSKELLEELRIIVGVIVLLATPLSVDSLPQLLEITAEDISELLEHLHSVLNIPSEAGVPVRIFHLSFRDYLLKTESVFHVDENDMHSKIVLHCLRVMDGCLKQNICGLAHYGTQRTDMESQTMSQHLSTVLQYCCRYWVHHFEHSEGRISISEVFAFLKLHFLHWLEALSLMGIVSEAVAMIDALQSGNGKDTDAKVSEFLYDAKRFILGSILVASTAPLQLYCCGLAFSPMQSIVRMAYNDKIPKWICTLPRVEDAWSPSLQTLTGHSDRVRSVAFSSDGSTLASGSDDTTIKLWDVNTGKGLQTLTSHLSWVKSVTFSSEGSTLASGSYDTTIKLWDVNTGKELQTLTGHSGSVTLLANSLTAKEHPLSHGDPIPSNFKPQVYLSDNWVSLAGKNLLLLPPAYRQYSCSAVKDGTLCLGYGDGRVLIIGLHTP
ncbi:WD40-repeat-containing domain protein [Aspergillus varians]